MTVRIELDHGAIDQFLKSGEIQNELKSVAQQRASGLQGDYEVTTEVQHTRAAAKITPANRKTLNHVKKHNDLIKAIK